MRRIIRNLALLGALPLALTACGGGSGQVAATTTPVATTPTTTAFQDRFGTSFSTAFAAPASTATPNHPVSTDVPALNVTAEPLDN